MADVRDLKEADLTKLCVHCKHYRHDRNFVPEFGFEHGCARITSPVTGHLTRIDAGMERDNFLEGHCGPSGQFYAPKLQEKLDVD